MYQPPHFQENRPDVMEKLIRAHPLATLVAVGRDGLIVNHFPLLYLSADAAVAGSEPVQGILQGHMAKANPLWRDFDPATEVVAVFQGPQTYVTPSWYPSKAEHGRVVPTWNYAVVHAHGPLTVTEDPAWLRTHLAALTATQEDDRAAPWSLTDAPAEFIDKQMKGIVGFEIRIGRLEGKWKMSQNRAEADRQGVVSGLAAEGGEQAARVSEGMAARRPD